MLMCFSRTDGKPLWQRDLDEGNRTWNKQNNSSPSPVTDGQHVWVVTGTGVVAAFDMDGDESGSETCKPTTVSLDSTGAMPRRRFCTRKLIVEVLHGNTRTTHLRRRARWRHGRAKWRVERPTDARAESPDAYTTPAVVNVEGRPQIVISGGDYVTGHDPATGEEIGGRPD